MRSRFHQIGCNFSKRILGISLSKHMENSIRIICLMLRNVDIHQVEKGDFFVDAIGKILQDSLAIGDGCIGVIEVNIGSG